MIETFKNLIIRKAYTERVQPYIGSHIIKILTGQRRTGKSYILYQLMEEIKKTGPDANLIYINTEFAEFRDIQDGRDLYEYVSARLQSGKANYVFIDEIQEIAGFEQGMKSLFAEEKCDLYCTGSNAHLLSGELATYLAGRYIQIQVHPLSYSEFLVFHGLENTLETLQKYLHIGGLPYMASLAPLNRSEELSQEYLRNIYESILLRDVIARENIRNIQFLENLAAYAADNTGSLFSANNISKYLKNQRVNMPVQTVITYLSALQKSFLVRKVSRIDIKGLKIFEIGEKYYFEDIGLRNILVKNPLILDIAKVIENAVYNFLVQRDFTVYVGSLGGAEIDFVAEKLGTKLYVQVAFRISDEETARREFGGLERIDDNFPKYVVTLDDYLPAYSESGIRCVHLKDFLMMDL
ncbi:MAG: ATP-binding protein [Treponema sp.]|jgi:predicted AAA+ superfamily ATPase|nr:ATP-binding protein [Treponema sp.]